MYYWVLTSPNSFNLHLIILYTKVVLKALMCNDYKISLDRISAYGS